MKAKLVLLHWKDAVSPTHGWTDINELETELAECCSVGFIVEENDKEFKYWLDRFKYFDR